MNKVFPSNLVLLVVWVVTMVAWWTLAGAVAASSILIQPITLMPGSTAMRWLAQPMVVFALSGTLVGVIHYLLWVVSMRRQPVAQTGACVCGQLCILSVLIGIALGVWYFPSLQVPESVSIRPVFERALIGGLSGLMGGSALIALEARYTQKLETGDFRFY